MDENTAGVIVALSIVLFFVTIAYFTYNYYAMIEYTKTEYGKCMWSCMIIDNNYGKIDCYKNCQSLNATIENQWRR
jgi:hypothetical protein